MKTHVYVDAFNLYFGAVKRTPYKWLDLGKFCNILLPKHQIESIKYFTAIVDPRPNDPGQPDRQRTYLRALRTLPNLEIVFGHFLTHRVMMPLATPPVYGSGFVEVLKTEEKGSDVNLATHLLHDAYLKRFECAVIVSGDSDLLTPVAIVIDELRLPVGVINPQKNPCRVLERKATFYKQVRRSAVKRSQFPNTMRDSSGTFSKPSDW